MSPTDIVNTLNKQFPYDHDRNQYFTLAYGVYDTENRVFRFISAGHPPPIHVSHTGETRHDWIEGIPIGIQSDFDYQENTLQLSHGDRVYLYSDGVLEVLDENEEPFGLDRMTRLLADSRKKSLRESVDNVMGDLETWGQKATFDDDVSILAFEAH
jgi:sigma-B regulation protein RsbU (phosphoserine phosphatase)